MVININKIKIKRIIFQKVIPFFTRLVLAEENKTKSTKKNYNPAN